MNKRVVFSSIIGISILCGNVLTIESSAESKTITSGLPSYSIDEPDITYSRTPTLSLDYTVITDTALADDDQLKESSGGSLTGSASKVEGGFSYEGVTITADERRWIANTVQHECGSYSSVLEADPLNSPHINVACVILNRYVANRPQDFPSTIKEIITQSGAFSGISGYWDRTDYASEEVYAAVDKALEYGDITGGALWFANLSIAPGAWAATASTTSWLFKDSAGHDFWKLKG